MMRFNKIRKLKLFPKIFLYTFSVMVFVIVIAHIMILMFAPRMVSSLNNFSVNGFLIENEINTGGFISEAILRSLPTSLALCLIIAFICSLLFSKVISNPIKKISATTEEMANLNQTLTCPIYSQDEIGILAKNINSLYKNLMSTICNLEEEKNKSSEAEKLKIDFLRSASHELKTPVTALNAILENMILGVGKYKNKDIYLIECKNISNKLSYMIKDILDTSRLDFMSESQIKERFDLAEMLHKICEPYSLIAKMNDIDFQIQIQGACNLNLSKKYLEKILSNLLFNAVSYTKAEHHILVILQKDKIMIENECTPIPKEMIPRLFEPFYRPDFARD